MALPTQTGSHANFAIMERIQFHVDRHFLFLHGRNLAVFAERVLRKTEFNINVPVQPDLWMALHTACATLNEVLADTRLKRKERTEAVREKEAPVLMMLDKWATYIESAATC